MVPRMDLLKRAKRAVAGLLALHLSLIDQGIASIYNFIPMICLARFSTPSDLGIYTVFVVLFTYLANVENALVTTPYTFFGHEEAGGTSCYGGSVLIHHVVFVTATSTALLVCGLALSVRFAIRTDVVCAGVLAGALVLSREFTRRFCFAGRQFGTVFWLDIGTALLQCSSIALLVRFRMLTAEWALYAVGISAIPHAIWAVAAVPRYHYGLSRAMHTLKSHWFLGKWMLLGACVSSLTRQIFPLSLAFFHGAAAAGMLAACTGLIQITSPGLIGFANYFAPVAARERREKGDRALRRRTRHASIGMAIVLAVFCALVFAFGTDLLAVVYGRAFAVTSNVRTLSLMAVALLCSESTQPIGLALVALNRPNVNVMGAFAGLCVTATIGLFAVRLVGIEGVGLGLLIGGITESGVKALQYATPLPLISSYIEPGPSSFCKQAEGED